MTIRKSISTAVLSLAFCGIAAVPAFGQAAGARSGANNANSQSAQAGKAVSKAQADVNKLQSDLSKISARVRAQILGKPEWAQVVAAKKTAEASADAARKAA